jgi:hypothetical protein
VTLNWAASTDDSTPVAALTYDLDLRLNGAPVATPVRLPEPGDVSAVTSWTLAGLPNGSYQWTVRAVDSALNPGAVAQGSFTVGPVANEPGAGLPREFALEAVYPNPFATTATVRYALPREADVRVVVFDMLGREVARLVDATRPAGYHEVRWDGAGAAVGTYVVRFSTDGFAASRRLTLIR